MMARRIRMTRILRRTESVELRTVVGAEDRHLAVARGSVVLMQLLEPFEVLPAPATVDGQAGLVRPEPRRAGPGGLLVPGVEVGISGVQEPAVPRPAYGDTAVSAGVTGQRDHPDVVADGLHGREAEPVVTPGVMLHPVRSVAPLGGDVAEPLAGGGVP